MQISVAFFDVPLNFRVNVSIFYFILKITREHLVYLSRIFLAIYVDKHAKILVLKPL